MDAYIMCCPGADQKRDENVVFLEDTLKSLDFEVRFSPDPERNGILWNYIQMLEAIVENSGEEPGWALTLQDDAKLRKGWHPEVLEAIKHSPTPVLYLDHNGRLGQTYREQNYAYLKISRGGWGRGVAYYLPVVPAILSVAKILQGHPTERYSRWDDVIPVVAGAALGFNTSMTTRSFVGSIPTKSLIGHPTQMPAKSTVSSLGKRPMWNPHSLAIQGQRLNPDIEETVRWVREKIGEAA